MAEEIERTPLPEGFKLKKREEVNRTPLPEGFKLKKKVETPTTPQGRDEAKIQKAAGVYAAQDKTPEEIKKMSVQERMQYAQDLNTEREYVQSSQFGKNALSGLTFGLSKNVDELKPIEFEETNGYGAVGTVGHVAGSLLPLSKLIKIVEGPALKLASKSPILQRQLSSLITMFGVGSANNALETVAKGEIPSADELLEHGASWLALDGFLQSLGFAGRMAKALITKSGQKGMRKVDILTDVFKKWSGIGGDVTKPETAEALFDILEQPVTEAEQAAGNRKLMDVKQAESPVNDVAQEALQPEKITPKDLKTKKLQDQTIKGLTTEIRVLSEPTQPKGINFTHEAETLAKDEVAQKIESVGTRAASEEDLGNSIRHDIETNLSNLKAEYRPLYTFAEKASESILHIPQNTARESGKKLLNISKLKTKPEGYPAVIKNLENVLEDAGFIIQRAEGKATGPIENIISEKSVPVSDTIELARRLNEMVDYEVVEPTVKEALRSVAKAAKADIRAGLKSNPEALAAFEMAEAEHARVASQFSKDSIRKVRGNEAGEKISKMAESPSTLGDLKQILSPEQMLQVEREMLEKLNSQTFDKSKKTLREVEKHLSAENRKLAREIVESKNPHNPLVRKKLTQDAILNDMGTALTNGSRPNKTLDLWKTPKGQKLVKETFHNSPNWPQVKTYLEKQSFNDMVASVLKDGKLDLNKFNSFMKDPAAVNNIRSQGGEEAVTFFRGLESKVKTFQENVKLLDKLPTKEQIQKGKTFNKESSAQNKMKRYVDESKRVEKSTGKIAKEELKIGERVDKGHEEAKRERGNKILERMSRKDYPLQSKINDWKEWVKDALGLNAQAAMNVFGIAKLGGATLGAYTFGIPSTVTAMVGYKLMNKMLTSPRMRKAFLEAAKHQSNPLKFVIAMQQLDSTMDEDEKKFDSSDK